LAEKIIVGCKDSVDSANPRERALEGGRRVCESEIDAFDSNGCPTLVNRIVRDHGDNVRKWLTCISKVPEAAFIAKCTNKVFEALALCRGVAEAIAASRAFPAIRFYQTIVVPAFAAILSSITEIIVARAHVRSCALPVATAIVLVRAISIRTSVTKPASATVALTNADACPVLATVIQGIAGRILTAVSTPGKVAKTKSRKNTSSPSVTAVETARQVVAW
jgi:hypothetical protein